MFIGLIAFSSPIGAFIFLIQEKKTEDAGEIQVFVPYRGFYFLNKWKLVI